MMNNKIAASVILYNQDENIFSNIDSYINEVDFLFIADNNSKPNEELYKELKNKYKQKLELICFGDNMGISYALNYMAKLATKKGYSYLLTMDQDSAIVAPNLISNFVDTMQNDNKIGIVAFSYITYKKLKHYEHNNLLRYRRKGLITSGNIVNLVAANSVGGWNEDLFIDDVDYEFCVKLRLKGYKLLTTHKKLLSHQIGEPIQLTSRKTGQQSDGFIHSPVRTYYIIRNALYIKNKYLFNIKTVRFGFKRWKIVRNLIKRIKEYYPSDLLNEHLKMVELAKKDFKENNMGKKIF